MTIKEKGDKLYQAFQQAWDNYTKIETNHAKSTGFKELLSVPELKKAYQQWQFAVNEYYDFAQSIENKDINEEYTGK